MVFGGCRCQLSFKMNLDFDKVNASAALREEVAAAVRSEVMDSLPNLTQDSARWASPALF